MKLNWVTIYVRDLEKSLYFYTEILGLNVSARFGDGSHQIVMLGEEDETKIELIFESNTKIENPGKGVSIGLETNNLESLIEELNNIGYKVTGPISPNPHIRFFFVSDPDGYTIQLIEKN